VAGNKVAEARHEAVKGAKRANGKCVCSIKIALKLPLVGDVSVVGVFGTVWRGLESTGEGIVEPRERAKGSKIPFPSLSPTALPSRVHVR
jgi:hypothetical protein